VTAENGDFVAFGMEVARKDMAYLPATTWHDDTHEFEIALMLEY
jgi:hypothetical protein